MLWRMLHHMLHHMLLMRRVRALLTSEHTELCASDPARFCDCVCGVLLCW